MEELASSKYNYKGTSGAQAVATDDLFEQCQSAVSESVCQPDTTMQQHTEKDAVTLRGTGNEGTSRRSGTSGDELTLPELAGTSVSQAIAADLVEECPRAVSESVCQPVPKTTQQHIEKGELASARNNEGTAGGDLTLPELADHLIRLKIETLGLNEEQQKAVYELLKHHATEYMKSRNSSKVVLPGVGDFLKHLELTYNVSCVTFNLGSLIISLDCKTLKGLDKLWNDYLSGLLNKVANKHLVTDEIIKNLSLRTINLKTTIDEENYLNCRKILMESSGEADSNTLSSQQGALDHGTASMTGMATAVDDKELLVKQENTDCVIRMEKARASRSVLHKASVNGQYEKVKKYLSSGYAVDIKDQFSLTPLHVACWYGQESVVKLLLEYGADVNATDKFQFTPLHKAERRNHHSIVKLLLGHKARPTLQQPPSLRKLGRRAFTRIDEHSGLNLLKAAALEGDNDTVEKASVHLESFVEEMKRRITGEKAFTFRGESRAHILSDINKLLRICREPVEGEKTRKLFKEILQIKEMYKEFLETDVTLTKLHSCAKGNDVEMAIELVLNYGMDVNVAAKRNITPLLWASTAASSLSIKTLIDLGADVNAEAFVDRSCCFCGSTALHSAILGNNAAVVKVLLANEVNMNIGEQQGNTALHSSTSKKLSVISQLLIDAGSKINGSNDEGETPLYSAIRGNSKAVVQLLLKNNADANFQDRRRNIPLHLSSFKGFSEISQLLIDAGSKINGSNDEGETPLYSAIRGNSKAVVQLLLKNNADANFQDRRRNIPLHLSSFKGFSQISQLLIDAGCKINEGNDNGETPLYYAIRGNNKADVQLLLMNNADANFQDKEGNTPLHISARRGFSDISQLLIDAGCKINGSNDEGETPLYSAIRGNKKADVQLLLKNNADANFQDRWRNTPLHISTGEGFSEISLLLIDAGCKINLGNDRDMSTFFFAVRQNDAACVERLLEHGANSSIQDSSGNTPLHRAICRGFSNISEMLIKSGCNVNLRNSSGATPLHCSVIEKSAAMVSLLIATNADANIQDFSGNTPLHLSVSKGFSEISQLLIEAECNTDLRNKRGETPLHSAVLENNSAVVKYLLKRKADANIQDQQGNTPLHISTFKEFSDISQLLIESGCDINLRNNRGESPFDVGPRPSPDTTS
ncbi:serine/threonine-protein phosphatase 6 regulatory ankyrin repeat subunit B-like isoform X2 [Acropora muricata]|uniref:serine/threonine-protein phosphatase 6 regulatory ankyrin repeat subunit B-like isoform X2 n=1 Tax=Acropora muricata TaxID=159855 RepID=UPI0034E3D2CA